MKSFSRPVLREIAAMTVRDRYASYPSRGLTPERLTAIFMEADSGNISAQAELFEEMEEKDAHLGAVLQSRKLQVAGLEWEIVAGEDRKDKEVASFVKEAIARVENWDEALLDLLDAIGKGFSVSEIMWVVEDGRVWANALRWRHQKKFTFLSAGGQISEEPRLLTDAAPVYGEELVPNKFIVHRYRARSGITPRGGVLRPCAYIYLFKNYCLKDWVSFNERFAMPMRVGKFSASATEAERKALREAVFNLGSDAAVVISDSTVIEILDSASKSPSAEIYERLLKFCDSAISKAVLGQTLTTEQTGGSYATARVHDAVRRDLLEADARALARTLTMQFIRPLVGFNFGEGTAVPAIRFVVSESEDLKALAETYKCLVEAGLDSLPRSYIHKRFGIPLPQEGEETLNHGGRR